MWSRPVHFERKEDMSHHASEFSKTDALLEEALKNKLGSIGYFPRGKIAGLVEGEIEFTITADHENEVVFINFGKPIVWLRVTADEAIKISNSLKDNAIELKIKSKH